MQGTWVSSCRSDESEYVKETFVVSGTDVSFKSDYFSDVSCTTLNLGIAQNFINLNVGDNVTLNDGTYGHRIAYFWRSIELTTYSSTFTEDYNSINFCGVNWVSNKPVDVLEKDCGSNFWSSSPPIKNSILHNLYSIVGNSLHLGYPTATPDSTTVNTSLYYTKQ